MLKKTYYKLVRISYEDTDYFRLVNKTNNTGTFSVTLIGSPVWTMDYSFDGSNWEMYDTTNHPNITVPASGYLYLRGNRTTIDNNNYIKFAMDVDHDVENNILSIVDKDNMLTMTTVPNHALYRAFEGDTHLILSNHMNFGHVTTAGNGCFSGLFRGCSSLVNSPDLSEITNLAESCYSEMFYQCSNLTATTTLPATTLANGCYGGMFQNCTSITTAPDLPATTTVQGCYTNMFRDCRALVESPIIHATSIVGYAACHYMFMDCRSLNKITIYVQSWNANNTAEWVTGVANTGDFYNLGGATIPRGNAGIPTNWTEHTSL